MENIIDRADKMFEELGYKRVREDKDSYEIRFIKKWITQIRRPKHIVFSVLDKTICVCEENEKELAVKRDWFSMQELKAINKKCEEQEKMIELMGKFINNTDIDEDICKVVGEKPYCDKYYNSNNCMKCVVEHFKKKAKGE